MATSTRCLRLSSRNETRQTASRRGHEKAARHRGHRGIAALVAAACSPCRLGGTNAIAPGNLAFAGVDPSDGMLDIDVAESDGTAQSDIANDTTVHKDSSPVWSPEGKRIVFTRQIANRGGSNIMLVNADGSRLVEAHLVARSHERIEQHRSQLVRERQASCFRQQP